MQRRNFLAAAGSVVAAGAFVRHSAQAAAAAKKIRVGVVGHTGRGNYGHGLDTVWLSIPECEIVAVADADADGLKAELKKLKVGDGFSDFREMYRTAKP